jgi:head-tail adaptor
VIKSHAVQIQRYSQAKNAEGIVVKTFAALKTIWADVQPKALSEVQAQAWGVNAQAMNTKWLGFDSDASIQELYRAIVDGVTYEIRGLNVWPMHSEALLIPVSGVAVNTFCMSLDIEALSGHSYVWMDSGVWSDAGVWHG